jgi:hypothetical protein
MKDCYAGRSHVGLHVCVDRHCALGCYRVKISKVSYWTEFVLPHMLQIEFPHQPVSNVHYNFKIFQNCTTYVGYMQGVTAKKKCVPSSTRTYVSEFTVMRPVQWPKHCTSTLIIERMRKDGVTYHQLVSVV